MAYDASIVDAIRARARQVSDPNARNRYLRAALQTGIVESGLRNLNHGDADSLGWRQERASLYKNPTNVAASVNRFFEEAAKLDRGQPSWQLAADVQRPAAQYRGRYKDVAAQAAKLAGGASGGTRAPSPAQPDSAGAAAVAPAVNRLAGLQLQQRQAAPVMLPAALDFAAKAPMPAHYQPQQVEPAADPESRFGATQISDALRALQQAQAEPVAAGAEASSDAPARSGSKRQPRAPGGKFKIEGPSPERLQKPLVSFAKKGANIAGQTWTGKDGSSHSKYTVNGNVSDHYSGNATDVFFIDGKPAQGERLIKAGRAALIAAGMPRAKALKAPGGLYNVNGHQIIFGVDGKQYGGNHLDHLHIST